MNPFRGQFVTGNLQLAGMLFGEPVFEGTIIEPDGEGLNLGRAGPGKGWIWKGLDLERAIEDAEAIISGGAVVMGSFMIYNKGNITFAKELFINNFAVGSGKPNVKTYL